MFSPFESRFSKAELLEKLRAACQWAWLTVMSPIQPPELSFLETPSRPIQDSVAACIGYRTQSQGCLEEARDQVLGATNPGLGIIALDLSLLVRPPNTVLEKVSTLEASECVSHLLQNHVVPAGVIAGTEITHPWSTRESKNPVNAQAAVGNFIRSRSALYFLYPFRCGRNSGSG